VIPPEPTLSVHLPIRLLFELIGPTTPIEPSPHLTAPESSPEELSQPGLETT
jgi:hypothetical protein